MARYLAMGGDGSVAVPLGHPESAREPFTRPVTGVRLDAAQVMAGARVVASAKVTLVWAIAAAASYRRASGRWTNQPCAIITPDMPKALTSWTHTAMMCAALAAGSVRPNLSGRLP